MALATWWQEDPLPDLLYNDQLVVCAADDDQALVALNQISTAEVRRRRAAGHKPYVAAIESQWVAYGWVATCSAEIGELGLTFEVPASDRYLWDFATRPDWQGQGLYPRLLQCIIHAEPAERFWIIHAPENLPSGAGMETAGFVSVGQLSFRADGIVGLTPLQMPERTRAGAALLNVPLLADELSPC